MDEVRLTATLPRFVEQVSQRYTQQDRQLTVSDLHLGIRHIRLSEIIDWSNDDLDVIELHAARFQDDAPLESVLSVAAPDDQGECAGAASSIGTPSPFAWT